MARYGRFEQLKKALEGVKPYDDEWKKVEGKNAKTNKSTSPSGTETAKKSGPAKGAASSKLKHDRTKDFLRKVLNKEIPLIVEAHRQDDIENALRLADELKLRLVLAGVSNPQQATTTVALPGAAPLILGPFAFLDESTGRYRDRPADWPTGLLADGGIWALGTFTDHPRGSRLLRVHAAAAVAAGIAPDQVLRALTRSAAEILGVDDRVGTIAPGKQADLAIFAGEPLDPSVPVQLVLSAGKVVFQAAGPLAVKDSSAKTKPEKTGEQKLPWRAAPGNCPRNFALKTEQFLTGGRRVSAHDGPGGSRQSGRSGTGPGRARRRPRF